MVRAACDGRRGDPHRQPPWRAGNWPASSLGRARPVSRRRWQDRRGMGRRRQHRPSRRHGGIYAALDAGAVGDLARVGWADVASCAVAARAERLAGHPLTDCDGVQCGTIAACMAGNTIGRTPYCPTIGAQQHARHRRRAAGQEQGAAMDTNTTIPSQDGDGGALWPALPYQAWLNTRETLHMWTQIVGKVKLELAPFLNEWWEVGFTLTARGLTTSTIPFGRRVFQIDFDFIDHRLDILVDDGTSRSLLLLPRSVADFYHEFMAALEELGIQVQITTSPV